MTPDQKRAIEQDCARLIAQYANLNDAARWADVAALYAENGRMSRPTAPDDWIEGRGAIQAAFEARPARTTRHFCSNIVVDVVNEREATAESAMLLFTADTAAKAGSFHDRFILTDEGWRFAERRGSLTFQG